LSRLSTGLPGRPRRFEPQLVGHAFIKPVDARKVLVGIGDVKAGRIDHKVGITDFGDVRWLEPHEIEA